LGDMGLKKKKNKKDYARRLKEYITAYYSSEVTKRMTAKEKKALTEVIYKTIKELEKLK
jgi:hypothetical protein